MAHTFNLSKKLELHAQRAFYLPTPEQAALMSKEELRECLRKV